MTYKGVTYNDAGTPGERLPATTLDDLDLRYLSLADAEFGTTAGTYTEGNDARLSDQRTPSDNSVTNAKMANLSVDTAELVDNAVTNAKLADNAVNTAEIASNAVTLVKMADASVGTSELVDDSVTVDKIGPGAVDATALATNAVTNAKVADDAIGIAELSATGTPDDTTFLRGDNTWTSGTVSIGDNTVTNAKMADDAVGIAELSATGTPSSSTFLRGDNTWTVVPADPYDVYYMSFSAATTRVASSYGDNPMGIKLARNVVFTSVTFRCSTASASGNLVAELRKNGTQVSGTSTTISSANQVAGGTSTGSWSFSAGDILTVYVTGVGTTPGKGLVADITGTAS